MQAQSSLLWWFVCSDFTPFIENHGVNYENRNPQADSRFPPVLILLLYTPGRLFPAKEELLTEINMVSIAFLRETRCLFALLQKS